MGRIEKTVFISCRRTDESWGLAVFHDLTQHGYDVFIDYDGRNFETVILENIRARAHFLVLLTPAALERCSDPNYWMRLEIEAALDSQRNIVPLMLEGFDFGTPASQLTGKLAALKKYNGLSIPKGYFSQAMERLRSKFLNVVLDASTSTQQVATEQKNKARMVLGETLHQSDAPTRPKVQRFSRHNPMGQKFFISFNTADQAKAHWIAWTLKEAGHEVAVHDWEIPAGGNAPLWMNTKLAWADRLIAVISPDYLPARYSPVEWASEIWNDPDGTKGAVIPVIVRQTPRIPPLLSGLSRIDLTNCSEAEAKSRLLIGVNMPEPPERKPAFERIEGEAPDNQHVGPVEKPIFIRGNVEHGLPNWLATESTAHESKGWMQRWTGRIAALTALLVAAVALMDAAVVFVNKTPSLTCSLPISLPWCNTNTAYLKIRSVSLTGNPNAAIQVKAIVNPGEQNEQTFTYPNVAGVAYVTVGPQMGPETFKFKLPGQQFPVRFEIHVNDGGVLTSTENTTVTPDGIVRRYDVHNVVNNIKSDVIGGTVFYQISQTPI